MTANSQANPGEFQGRKWEIGKIMHCERTTTITLKGWQQAHGPWYSAFTCGTRASAFFEMAWAKREKKWPLEHLRGWNLLAQDRLEGPRAFAPEQIANRLASSSTYYCYLKTCSSPRKRNKSNNSKCFCFKIQLWPDWKTILTWNLTAWT